VCPVVAINLANEEEISSHTIRNTQGKRERCEIEFSTCKLLEFHMQIVDLGILKVMALCVGCPNTKQQY